MRPGVSLYERSLESRRVTASQKLEERRKDTQAEIEWKEVAGCTFRPQINH